MKFTNTKTQCKEVGANAKAFGKATWALVKSTSKVPYMLGLDIGTYIKERKAESKDEA